MNKNKKFVIEISLEPADRLKHSYWKVMIFDEGTRMARGITTEEFFTDDQEASEEAYNALCETLTMVIGRRVIADIELNFPELELEYD